MTVTKIPEKVQISAKDVTEGRYLLIPNTFRYRRSQKNDKYVSGCLRFDEVREPLRACLYSNKSGNNSRVKTGLLIRTEPRYITTLTCSAVDAQTGEISTKEYITDDLKRGNKRKINRLDAFCSYYQPLYRTKKVSLFLVTFTEADQAIQGKEWSRMIEAVKYRFKSMGYDVRGYIWTMEISTENYHFHYHLCVAVNRMDIRGQRMPDNLKFDDLWNRKTEIAFVKKNVRNYLSKYFAKNRWRLQGSDGKVYRNYGISKIIV
jgi:hypothetical protein